MSTEHNLYTSGRTIHTTHITTYILFPIFYAQITPIRPGTMDETLSF